MTSRRRNADSGNREPGSAAWRDQIQRIRQELDADNRLLFFSMESQDSELLEVRQSLEAHAESIQIKELLAYINDNLLRGEGVIETTFRWETQDEGDDDGDEDEDDDDEWDEDEEDEDDNYLDEEQVPVLSITLTWKWAGRLLIVVDLLDEDEGIGLRINGDWMTSATARHLQSGLVNSLQEQISEISED